MNSPHTFSGAKASKFSLPNLESLPEKQSTFDCEERTQKAGQFADTTPVIMKEKFPEHVQYLPPSLRRQSPRGSCDLPTVYSGELMTLSL